MQRLTEPGVGFGHAGDNALRQADFCERFLAKNCIGAAIGSLLCEVVAIGDGSDLCDKQIAFLNATRMIGDRIDDDIGTADKAGRSKNTFERDAAGQTRHGRTVPLSAALTGWAALSR